MNAPERQAQFFSFDNSYARLPERFFARLPPTPVEQPSLIRINEALAHELGLEPTHLSSHEGVAVLSGNRIAAGSEPIAMAYAGHQFGSWVPQLGDGRAILLGEVTDRNGVRRDIQLKGAGPTPFSRMGDGRAAVGPVLREYIVSEGMAALGVPTTRALAAVTTGEPVLRETVLPGAILTRVSQSHIRVGTFQFFAAREDTDALRLLADHVIARHYADLTETSQPYVGLLRSVMERQAQLIAQWMGLGFIHGVMNTDNMSVAGETIDYGPCAFMDTFHPDTVFSSIDQMGRYSYRNQPRIAQWNLARFAQCLLPLLDDDKSKAIEIAQAEIDGYPDLYQPIWLNVMRRKIGLTQAHDDDLKLVEDLLEVMARHAVDFTLFFRALSDVSANDPLPNRSPRDLVAEPGAYDAWESVWWQRLRLEQSDDAERQSMMRQTNPRFIPRNHLVEEAITSAVDNDLSAFERLLVVLQSPFDDQPEHARFAEPPQPDEVVAQTFCGT
ncbi:MAG: protein adenylyltransferase SelO [Hyphomicrobiaceae bacterium]